MTHTRVRAIFVVGAALAAIALAGAAVMALQPAEAAPAAPNDLALARASALSDGVPAAVAAKELAPLEREAWRQRAGSSAYRPMMGPPQIDELPIYIVKTDGVVRAFIGLDPRNGCRLETIAVSMQPSTPAVLAFHDVCHGSLYDLAGERLGGPTPWTLDQLVVDVRNDLVYVARHAVIPGRLVR